jgi:hypothetical protein
MKKLLILAYDFPPYVSVGGLRPYNWYKYLKEYGVEPVVITRQWQNKHGNHLDYVEAGYSDEVIVETTEFGTIVRTPYRPNLSNRLLLTYGPAKFKVFRKLISGFYEFIQFCFPIGPKSAIYFGARDYLKNHKVDAIIATGDPFILFAYAARLGKEFNTPWIADYRDPWSHNHDVAESLFQRKWYEANERKIVRSSTHITTVSSFVFQKIQLLIPGKKHTILPNGYDPEVIDSIRTIPKNADALQIGFVGTVYDWHPIQSFLRECNAFIISNPESKLQLNFYGTNLQEELQEMVCNTYPNLADKVLITARMPNLMVLEKLATNHVVLLFNYYSYMGTKIFDYLGIKRKIILCYSEDTEALELKRKYYHVQEVESESGQLQADLINETHSGIVVKDAEHLKHVLADLWQEFSQTGDIRCDSVGIENYSRKIQVEKLAEIIQGIDALKNDEQKG